MIQLFNTVQYLGCSCEYMCDTYPILIQESYIYDRVGILILHERVSRKSFKVHHFSACSVAALSAQRGAGLFSRG